MHFEYYLVHLENLGLGPNKKILQWMISLLLLGNEKLLNVKLPRINDSYYPY